MPEIDNVSELDHEKRNRVSVENYRNKMSDIILHKDKRTITKYFLEIFKMTSLKRIKKELFNRICIS